MVTALDTRFRATAKRLLADKGKTYTVIVYAKANSPTLGKVTKTPTTHAGVKGSPPEHVSEWQGDKLVGAGWAQIDFAALDLPFVPKKGAEIQFVRDGLTQKLVIEKVVDVYSGDLIALHECLCQFQGES